MKVQIYAAMERERNMLPSLMGRGLGAALCVEVLIDEQ